MPQTNLFFPLPLHITTTAAAAAASSAFTPLDPTRFMPNYAGSAAIFDHFPPTAAPFGSSAVVPPSSMPTLAPLKPMTLDKTALSESIFNKIAGDTTPPHPTPTGHSINSILNFKAEAAAAAAKENEVSSSEESVLPRPSTTSGSDESAAASQESKTETEILFETAAKLLFLAVKWAKSVPSFLQLPTADQKILLEESWAELFVITAAQWGLPIDCDFIARNPSAKKLQAIIQQFTLARVDYREAACLKALILFRSDHASLFSSHEILLLQDQTIALLHEKCGGVRLGHLLLLLPGIKAAANGKNLQEMLFRKTIGEVAIERLLVDLMKT